MIGITGITIWVIGGIRILTTDLPQGLYRSIFRLYRALGFRVYGIQGRYMVYKG